MQDTCGLRLGKRRLCIENHKGDYRIKSYIMDYRNYLDYIYNLRKPRNSRFIKFYISLLIIAY